MAHCRAIEEMLKAVEEETKEKNRRRVIPYFLNKTSYTFEQICDLLEIPEDERQKYSDLISDHDRESK